LPPEQPDHAARVRIFTPYVELPFAGHPTVGTGWVLLDEGNIDQKATEFVLEEGVGPVPVRIERGAGAPTLWMTHPPVRWGDVVEEREAMTAALGLTAADLMPGLPIQLVSSGFAFVFVALNGVEAVDRAVSNKEALIDALHAHGLPPVFLFAAVGGNRLYSRMFGPHSSTQIAEDPATGSASGPLGAFAVRYGLVKRGPEVDIVSEQGTKMGRQSFVHIKLGYEGEEPARIEVGGSVMPVMTADLVIPKPSGRPSKER
jgi:trans-2,3-dihydro-3-hydroxyanthranilate isomerase